MKEVKKKSKRITWGFDQMTNPTVVGVRFHMAFPELTELFAWLNEGVSAGAAWKGLVDRHLKKIGPDRAVGLAAEACDILAMGLTKDRDIETLVCYVMGLDRAVLISETIDSPEFLVRLREHVVGAVAAA